jgi:hypothetical protein
MVLEKKGTGYPMNPATVLTWEGRLTRLSALLLALAALYGVIVGAVVTMYYDLTPDMGTVEDSLASSQFVLFLLAIILGLTHLPLALADLARRRWAPAAIRTALVLGPILVFLGTDGLLAHLLWWEPISDTDRFHILHHSAFAGIPLAIGFWLLARAVWRPALLGATPTLSWGFLLTNGIALLMIAAPMGILFGFADPILVAGIEILGLLALLALLVIGRMKR